MKWFAVLVLIIEHFIPFFSNKSYNLSCLCFLIRGNSNLYSNFIVSLPFCLAYMLQEQEAHAAEVRYSQPSSWLRCYIIHLFFIVILFSNKFDLFVFLSRWSAPLLPSSQMEYREAWYDNDFSCYFFYLYGLPITGSHPQSLSWRGSWSYFTF